MPLSPSKKKDITEIKNPTTPLEPSKIATFVSLSECGKFFKLGVEPGSEPDIYLERKTQYWEESFRRQQVIQKVEGDSFERSVLDKLASNVAAILQFDAPEPDPFDETVKEDTSRFASTDRPRDTDSQLWQIADNSWRLPETDNKVAQTTALLDSVISFCQGQRRPNTGTQSEPGQFLSELPSTTLDSFLDGSPLCLFQPSLEGTVESWWLFGDADFIFIEYQDTADNADTPTLELTAVDAKMAVEKKTHHQIQASIYSLLLRDLLSQIFPEESNSERGQTQSVEGSELSLQHLEVEFNADVVIPADLPRLNESLATRSFDIVPRWADIRRLLASDGPFAQLSQTPFEEVDYAIESKCDGCPFNEVCVTRGLERGDLSVIGIGEAIQQKLRSHGVHTVEDVAALGHPPDEYRSYHYGEDMTLQQTTETFDEIAGDPSFGEDLTKLVIDARNILSMLKPNSMYADNVSSPSWYLRSGISTLPEDSPPPTEVVSKPYYDRDELFDFEPETLIRVYLNVQYDNARNRIVALSGAVEATALEGDSNPTPITAIDTDIPRDADNAHESEAKLLATFFEQLNTAIRDVSTQLPLDSSASKNAPVHFYLYSEREYQLLIETLAFHSPSDDQQHPRSEQPGTVPIAQQYHAVLSRKNALSQPMISVVEQEIHSRLSLPLPASGLVQIASLFYSYETTRKRPTDWKYVDKDGKETDLRDVFGHLLFDSQTPFKRLSHNGNTNGTGITATSQSQSKATGTQEPLLRFLLSEKDSELGPPDGWAETRRRVGANIPLAYFWAASGKLTDSVVERVNRHSDSVWPGYDYLYRDADRTEPIRTEDLEALLEHVVDALRSVERGIDEKSLDVAEQKFPINPSVLEPPEDRDSLDSSEKQQSDSPELSRNDLLEAQPFAANSLAEACIQFLDLEHTSSHDDRQLYYSKAPLDRLKTGESILIRVTETETSDDDGTLRANAEFGYKYVDEIENPEQYRRAIRQKDATGSQSGTRLNATPVTHDNAWKPSGIESGIETRLVSLNPSESADEEVVVELKDPYFHKQADEETDDKFQPVGKIDGDGRPAIHPEQKFGGSNQKSWTLPGVDEDNKFNYVITEGTFLILDPKTSNAIAAHTEKALRDADENALYRQLVRLHAGDETILDSGGYDDETVTEFLSRLNKLCSERPEWRECHDVVFPNANQRNFIETSDSPLSLLHGPPGTGKTAGGIGPSILSRIYAAGMEGERCRTLVTGPSNKSIDEVCEDVAALRNALVDAGEPAFENVELVRICGNEKPAPEEQKRGVTYLSYRSEKSSDLKALDDLKRRLFDTALTQSPDSIPHVVVFATPTRSWLLMRSLVDGNASAPETELANGTKLYDLLVVDEASMMSLPKLFLASSFHTGRQTLFAGDHHQMPPVTKHDWREEMRPGIRDHAPYLSALDFLRVLRGESVAHLPDAVQKRLQPTTDDHPATNIPVVRLPKSYRSHKKLCQFLETHVYSRDGIPYHSEQTDTVQLQANLSAAVETALSPDQPITLVVYDDTEHRQSNPLEAELISTFVPRIHPSESVGVVTPHNAQRGLVTQKVESIELSAATSKQSTRTQQGTPRKKGSQQTFTTFTGNKKEQTGTDDSSNKQSSGVPDTTVDTVERFQGGQRDVMFLSATVSDPEYISAEERFLLNRNRLNVAVSRMKKKLVVVAARSIFEHIALDTDDYDHTTIWKALSLESGVNDPAQIPAWNGTLDNILRSDGRQSDEYGETKVEIYHLP